MTTRKERKQIRKTRSAQARWAFRIGLISLAVGMLAGLPSAVAYWDLEDEKPWFAVLMGAAVVALFAVVVAISAFAIAWRKYRASQSTKLDET